VILSAYRNCYRDSGQFYANPPDSYICDVSPCQLTVNERRLTSKIRTQAEIGTTVKYSYLVAMLLLCLCSSTASSVDQAALMADLTPKEWRKPGVWYFYLTDEQQRDLGRIVLLLTDEIVGSEECTDRHWRKAIVMDTSLDFDFGVDLQPAYNLHGPWLTVELTASSCSLNHRLVGDVSSGGAAGSFHYLHALNASIVGTFSAKPVVETY
jgi:hypothetical protein